MRESPFVRAAVRVLISLAIAGLATGTAWAQDADPGAATVTIDNYQFAPAEVWVTAGGSVSWTNNQAGMPHTITSADGLWDSGPVAPSETFVMSFSDVGDFAYGCTIHLSMQGVVHVVDDASEIPPAASAPSPTAVPAAAPAPPPPPAPTSAPAPVATAVPIASTPVPTVASQPTAVPTPRPYSPPSRYSSSY